MSNRPNFPHDPIPPDPGESWFVPADAPRAVQDSLTPTTPVALPDPQMVATPDQSDSESWFIPADAETLIGRLLSADADPATDPVFEPMIDSGSAFSSSTVSTVKTSDTLDNPVSDATQARLSLDTAAEQIANLTVQQAAVDMAVDGNTAAATPAAVHTIAVDPVAIANDAGNDAEASSPDDDPALIASTATINNAIAELAEGGGIDESAPDPVVNGVTANAPGIPASDLDQSAEDQSAEQRLDPTPDVISEKSESEQPDAPTSDVALSTTPEATSDVNRDELNATPNADNAGSPQSGTPQPDPRPAENLPPGSGLSSEVDYSNYVPGRGFVPKEEAVPVTPVTPVEAITPAPAVSVAASAATPVVDPASADAVIARAVEAQPVTDPNILAEASRIAAASPANKLDQPVNVTVSAPAGSSVAVDTNVQPPPRFPTSSQTPPPATASTPVSAPNPTGASASVASPASTALVAADLAKPPVNPSLQQRFLDVERAVHGLRRRYQTGMISREDLQAELRKLMFTDEGGKYWMIGMESDNWYQYDGRTWALATPPGYTPGAKPAVMGVTPDAAPKVPTGSASAGNVAISATGSRASVPANEEVPLPKNVPVYDDGATIVGRAAPRLDNTLREPAAFNRRLASEKGKTSTNAQVEAGMTVPGRAVSAGITQPSAAISAGMGGMAGGAAIPAPVAAEPLQPDYGPKPTGFSANRQQMGGCLIRGALVGTFAALALAILGIIGAVVFYGSTIGRYSENINALASNIDAKTQSVVFLDSAGRDIYQMNDPNLGARTRVPLSEISPFLIHAVISTENERFYEDPGFDVIAITRAILQNIAARGGVSGASTITQQLTRNEILETGAATDRSTTRKINEILVSSEVARRYTKSQIMEYYLNTVYFGNLAYGAEAAARVYFNKSAKDLNLSEASFLAGLIQSPAGYDPAADRGVTSLKRAEIVRGLMATNGCVQMDHAPYNTAPFCVTRETLAKGENVRDAALMISQMSNFRPAGFNATYPHFVQYVKTQLDELFPGGSIYTGGYKVYTTIDPTLQDLAQAAVTQQLQNIAANNAKNAAVLVIRPTDGAILAMVGSADFNNVSIDGQVNVVTAARQPGSALKPFIYTAAMERDGNNNFWSAANVLWDVPTSFGNYTPLNYDRRFHGPQTIRYALSNSYNIPAVKALDYVTISRFEEFAKRVGLTFPLTQPQDGGLPLALGGVETRMIDLVRAYAVYANQGVRVPSFAISRVTKRGADGTEEVVYQNQPPQGSQVVEPSLTWIISEFLSDNTARTPAFGATSALNLGGYKAAVKTGTSNDYRDNWTVGYNPDFVVGVWVGNTKGEPMTNVSGVTGAAPIWRAVMLGALNGRPGNWYQRPAGVKEALICADFGTLAFQECKNQRTELYWEPNPPTSADNIFVRRQVDTFSGLIANANCPNFVEESTFLNVTDASALNWLNTTPAGAAFLANYNLTQPVQGPPTQECPAGVPQPDMQINAPQEGQTVAGNVQVTGLISIPAFARYQIEISNNPAANDWRLVYGPSSSQQLQPGGFLGGWDSSAIPDGQYSMRVIGYDQQGHSAQLRRTVIVNNTQVLPGVTAGSPILIETPIVIQPFGTLASAVTATPIGLSPPIIDIQIATFTPVGVEVFPAVLTPTPQSIAPVQVVPTVDSGLGGGSVATTPCFLNVLAAIQSYSDYTLQTAQIVINPGIQLVILADAGNNTYGFDPTGVNAQGTPFNQLWWMQINPANGGLSGTCAGLPSPVTDGSAGGNFAPVIQ